MKENGELTVVGSSSIEIKLVRRPRHVGCRFEGEPKVVPCDPHHDMLEYFIFKKQENWYLEIKWDVSGAREVKWEARY